MHFFYAHIPFEFVFSFLIFFSLFDTKDEKKNKTTTLRKMLACYEDAHAIKGLFNYNTKLYC